MHPSKRLYNHPLEDKAKFSAEIWILQLLSKVHLGGNVFQYMPLPLKGIQEASGSW